MQAWQSEEGHEWRLRLCLRRSIFLFFFFIFKFFFLQLYKVKATSRSETFTMKNRACSTPSASVEEKSFSSNSWQRTTRRTIQRSGAQQLTMTSKEQRFGDMCSLFVTNSSGGRLKTLTMNNWASLPRQVPPYGKKVQSLAQEWRIIQAKTGSKYKRVGDMCLFLF